MWMPVLESVYYTIIIYTLLYRYHHCSTDKIPNMKKEFCYEEAVERLEKIVAEMEDSHQDIDHLIDRLKEAKGLIKQCKEKLYKIDKAIKELEEEDEE